MTCPHCADRDELAAEVDRLRAELGHRAFSGVDIALRKAFRLAPKEARILTILYEADGRPVSPRFLVDEVLSETAYPETLKVHVSHLRAKIGQGLIETVYEAGYRLNAEGRTLVQKALHFEDPA